MDHTESAISRRRRYSRAFKRQVVEETLAEHRSVSEVAQAHGINTNLVFRWRQAYRQGRFDDRASLIPVNVVADEAAESTSVVAEPRPTASRSGKQSIPTDGHLSITTAAGHHLAVSGSVDPDVLRAALEVLQ